MIVSLQIPGPVRDRGSTVSTKSYSGRDGTPVDGPGRGTKRDPESTSLTDSALDLANEKYFISTLIIIMNYHYHQLSFQISDSK